MRRALIGAIVASLGIAATLGVGYPAGAKSTKSAKGNHARCPAAAKSRAGHHRPRAKCKKAGKTTHGPKRAGRHAVSPAVSLPAASTPATPTITTPMPGLATVNAPPTPAPPTLAPEAAPQVASVMLTVYVYTDGCTRRLDEGQPVRVTRLGAGEEALGTIETDEYIVHVVPGRYELTTSSGTAHASTQVEVTAGQQRVVMLNFPAFCSPPGREAGEAEELDRAHHASNTPTATLVAAGKSLFADQCSACHGSKGEGTNVGPALTESSLTRAQSVGGVMEQLISPVGAMPNFRDELSLEEKEALGAYVCVDITSKCED